MKLAEILTGPETWWQGSYLGPDQRICLEKALCVLGEAERWHGAQWSRETARLRQFVPAPSDPMRSAIPTWNDDPARTWDEIVEVRDAYDRDRMLNP